MPLHTEDNLDENNSWQSAPAEQVYHDHINPRQRTLSTQSLTSQSSTETRCRLQNEAQKNTEGCGSFDGGRENFGYGDSERELNVSDNVHDSPGADTAENDSRPDAIARDDSSTIVKGGDAGGDGDASGVDGDGQTVSCSFDRFKGVALALLSTMLVSICSLNTALLTGAISSHEIVFTQMFFYSLFSVPLGVFHRASLRISRTALFLILYRCISGSVVTILVYYAFQVMPIGNAKAIIYSSPVFTSFFSCLILHDPCDAIDFVLSIITLSGVILVIQPPFIFGDENSSSSPAALLGASFCLIGAIILGSIYIALRKLGVYRVHATTIIVIYAVIGMAISALFATIFHDWVIPGCGRERQLLIMNGTFAFLSQLFVTMALKYETPTTVALIRTSDVLFTFALDYFFFGTVPNAITITGATVIIGCLVAITLRKWRTGKKLLKELDEKAESLHEDVSSENYD